MGRGKGEIMKMECGKEIETWEHRKECRDGLRGKRELAAEGEGRRSEVGIRKAGGKRMVDKESGGRENGRRGGEEEGRERARR